MYNVLYAQIHIPRELKCFVFIESTRVLRSKPNYLQLVQSQRNTFHNNKK